MAPHSKFPKSAAQSNEPLDPDGWDKDPGRPLGLRLLALVGALSFLALGVSSLLPTLQRTEPAPQPKEPAVKPSA